MKLNKLFLSIIIFALLGVIAYSDWQSGRSLTDSKIEKISHTIIKRCAGESYRPLCYETEIASLARNINMEDSFKVTRSVQGKDPSYAYCHVLAHKITFLEAKRKPGQWKDIITRCPIDMCNYGCLHGSLIEHFKGEILNDTQIETTLIDLQDVCEIRPGFNPSEMDQNMCYHAMGHLGMYMTGGNPQKAIYICQKVAVKDDGRDYYETCVEGVFMTIYQGIDEEDIALVAKIKPQKEDVGKFCSEYQGLDYEACHRESYPLFVDKLNDPSYASDFCSYSKDEHGLWKCYATVASNNTIDLLEEGIIDEVDQFCLRFPVDRVENCFANTATRMVQVDINLLDQALTVCHQASLFKAGDACYNDLITFLFTANRPGSQNFTDFCQRFPGSWLNKCLQRKTNQ
jgi:hypothetical protein